MAEEHTNKVAQFESNVGGDNEAVESKDRGMFDFLGKKEEEQPKPQQEAIATEFEKVKIDESNSKAEDGHEEGEKQHSLLEKLHRSDSSSSSSSDEEEGEGGEKKKKKKNKDKKEKIEEKIGGDKKADDSDTAVPVEKSDEQPEKKGFIDKIKEKLPGVSAPSPPPTPAAVPADKVAVEHHEEESKEKKGFLEKIKEKLPLQN
ncbi:hypothetical protein V6N13_118139 [Hibiscus sabdariffa]|uniref:Dehydrin n=1 Tax=Hibiscus sabdariffa TaxID=183260 RepID=A0ABR2Q8P7_9ROSI